MAQVQAYFDQVAPVWDELRRNHFSDRLARQIQRRVLLDCTMDVADIGTGTGFMALALAPRVRSVTGVDLSAEMVAKAAAKADGCGYDNVRFVPGRVEHLPLADATFDAVFTNMMLHHVATPAQAIQEMVRILKPQGYLVVADLDAHPCGWVRAELAAVWQGFRREDVIGWLAQAGLTDLEIGWSGCNCTAQSAQGEVLSASIFIAKGRKGVEP